MDGAEASGRYAPDVFDARCPSRLILRDVTGRWAPLVLMALDDGLTRFGDLHRYIGGSNERMLSQTLSTLTGDRLVTRELDQNGRPAYTLTEGGHDIAARLLDLRDAIYRHLTTAESDASTRQ